MYATLVQNVALRIFSISYRYIDRIIIIQQGWKMTEIRHVSENPMDGNLHTLMKEP